MNNNQNQEDRSQNERGSQQSGQQGGEQNRMSGNEDFQSGQGMGSTYSGSRGLEDEDMQNRIDDDDARHPEDDRGQSSRSSEQSQDESYEAQSGSEGLRSDENWGSESEEDTLEDRNIETQNRDRSNQGDYDEQENEA